MIVITIARKPIVHRSVTRTTMENGCGALNIEDCRIAIIPNEKSLSRTTISNKEDRIYDGRWKYFGNMEEPSGRWPANLILTPTSQENMNAQSGISKSTGGIGPGGLGKKGIYGSYSLDQINASAGGFGDTGGASRYFKVFK